LAAYRSVPPFGKLRTGKHVPPDIKRHRIPAPELSFTGPNLPVLIEEVEQLLKG